MILMVANHAVCVCSARQGHLQG